MRKTALICVLTLFFFIGIVNLILAQYSFFKDEKNTRFSLIKNDSTSSVQDYDVELSTVTLITPQSRSDQAQFFGKRSFLQFNRRLWNRLLSQQETARQVSARTSEGIEFSLPYESKLNISGRKIINIKNGRVKFKHPDLTTIKGTPSGVTEGLDMQQELQVRIKGKVGPKISVNIDYDDTKDDKRAISVVYKGDPDEVVQEAAFGDIDLSLPQTEFVAYNKKLFGGRIDTLPVDTKNNRLRVLAIGSRTKGITETKTFKGDTTFEKINKNDSEYVHRKYYKIYPTNARSLTDLPIGSNSAEIYIDDKIGTNNPNDPNYGRKASGTFAINAEDLSTPGVPYRSTNFFKLNPGTDYILDYRTGIITFNLNIAQNYVIVVDYKRPNGQMLSADNGLKKIIKNEADTFTREQRNYYNLGSTRIINDANKFIIKIVDQNQREQDINKFPYEVDYDLGILHFKSDQPFADPAGLGFDVYTKDLNKIHSNYIINLEYQHVVKTYNLRPGLVQNSETVKVNGHALKKDEDYFIDYDIGLLTFLKDATITKDTNIEVSYEYTPFGGQFEQTIVGTRVEYELGNLFTLGSTVLYNWATPAGNIPDVRSTPESILVMEADSKLKLRPGRLGPLNLTGLNVDLGAEVAQSKYNPDTFGKAMIDNMEGAEVADGISLDKNQWRWGSPKKLSVGGLLQTDRGDLFWDNGDEEVKTINPTSSDTGKMQVLNLNYSLANDNSWVSMVNPLSAAGVDYSKYLYLQMWVYGTGKGEKLYIDLGRVSEDVDGAGGFGQPTGIWQIGSPKTEDLNNNGQLDVGEDTGWDFVKYNADGSTSIIKIGSGNGRLDSEDLNSDGVLNTIEMIPNLTTRNDGVVKFDSIKGNYVEVNWSGWQQVSIPLDINASNLANWQSVKQMRLWLQKGPLSPSGSIRVAGLEAVGNRWDKPVLNGVGSLAVSVKSTDDDGKVSLKDDGDYQWLYKDVPSKDLDKNKTLVFTYTNLGTDVDAYIRRQFSKSQDYSKHRKLRFFVYGDAKGEKLYIRIGGSDSDYYEYSQPITWVGWQLVSIDLPQGFTGRVGAPNLANISFIRLGLIGNATSGEIWLDEMHLTDPVEDKGLAHKFTLDTTYTDWGTANATYRNVDDKFAVIGVPKVNQDITSRSVSAYINKVKILPTKFSWDKTTTITPTTFRTILSSQIEGRVTSDNLSAETNLIMENVPQVGLNFSRQNTDSNLLQKRTQNFTYGGKLLYATKPEVWEPLKLILPDNFNSFYNRIHRYTFYDPGLKVNQAPGFEDLFEEEDYWSATPSYQFQFTTKNNLNRLILTPGYTRRKVSLTTSLYSGEKFKRKKSDSQITDFSTQIDFFKWLSPVARYTVNTSEVYTVNASSKDVNRSATTEITHLLRMRDLLTWRPVDSLSFNNHYRKDEGDIYQGMDANTPTLNKLWLRKQLDPNALKSTNQRITFDTTANWRPLEFLNLTGGWRPFKTIETITKYTRTNEHQFTTGTNYDSMTKIWPDITLIISDLEKFPKVDNFLDSSRIDTRYYLKKTDKKNISFTREDFWSGKWRGRLFLKDTQGNTRYSFTLLLNADNTKTKEFDPLNILIRRSLVTTKGGQINFRTKRNYIYVLSYEDKKQTDRDRFDVITRQDYTRTPSLKLDKDLEFPKGLRIPFTRKVWALKNLIHLSSTLKTIMQRSNIAERNTDTYSGSLSIDYNVSYNFVLTFGVDGSLVKNKISEMEINDYYTYGANFKLLIRF